MSKNEYIITINATEHTVHDETISYDQVVQLAYPEAENGPDNTFSITFEHAKEPKQGTLAKGGTVVIKKRNTEFDVVPANRS